MLWLGLRALLRHPRRTIGIVLAVMLGTGSLFLVHGFNAGIMNQYRFNTIHAIFGDGEIRTTGYADKVFERPWDHWIADYDRVKSDAEGMPEVGALFPRVSFQALLSSGDRVATGLGVGVDGLAESGFFTTMNVERGHDLRGEPDGIVLGRELATALGVDVGDRVTVLVNDVHGSMNGGDFHVTGVFHTGTQSFDSTGFKLQLPRAQEMLDVQRVERIQVGLAPGATFAPVAARFPGGGAAYEAVPFEVLDAAQYGNSVRFLDTQFQIVRLVVLAVVILGLTGVLTSSILERRSEIGTLRANGESHGDVLKLLAVEASAIGVLGGIAGILYGLFVVHVLVPDGILMPPAPGITRQFFVRIELQAPMALQVVLLGMVVVLVASQIAARRVLRASVAELLRAV